mmetsp:Transcript_13515/g.34000  ORF Transcript_13515/g.34000 Transcript_13515/m.34000 type:complete len:295 (+) Transcript_13515:859-1743(+)
MQPLQHLLLPVLRQELHPILPGLERRGALEQPLRLHGVVQRHQHSLDLPHALARAQHVVPLLVLPAEGGALERHADAALRAVTLMGDGDPKGDVALRPAPAGGLPPNVCHCPQLGSDARCVATWLASTDPLEGAPDPRRVLGVGVAPLVPRAAVPPLLLRGQELGGGRRLGVLLPRRLLYGAPGDELGGGRLLRGREPLGVLLAAPAEAPQGGGGACAASAALGRRLLATETLPSTTATMAHTRAARAAHVLTLLLPIALAARHTPAPPLAPPLSGAAARRPSQGGKYWICLDV